MAFGFFGKSKCHSWRVLLWFLGCYLSSESGICFSGKCKCHCWRPLLGFLDCYLSSENGICFFRKKQMPLLEDFAWVFGLKPVIWEWHLLFPEKANATPGGLCLGFWTFSCHLRMAFAFSGKSKCHSEKANAIISMDEYCSLCKIIVVWHPWGRFFKNATVQQMSQLVLKT